MEPTAPTDHEADREDNGLRRERKRKARAEQRLEQRAEWKASQKAKRKRKARPQGGALDLPPEAAGEEVRQARQARKAAELEDFRKRCGEGTTATGFRCRTEFDSFY